MALEVIAHRGASGTCPENTLPAFRRAVEVGASMVELDVQLTRDGHPIVIHDWTLERTTSGRGPVRRHTRAEIATLDAGRWFAPGFAGTRVPGLDEVLAAVPIRINVELKAAGDDGLERRVLETVEEAGALGRVVFSSFDPSSLERLRALSAEAELAVLWAGRTIARALALADRVGARSVHLRKGARAAAAIAAGHAAGLAMRVWTVNSPADFTRLTDAGADGVFTDYPERFLHTPRG
jgi:glycerophosphoryl diester phosphodiesterase